MRGVALALAALVAAQAHATPVSVCRDATYEIPAARGAVCSGAGASPAGKACPRKGDAATASCHPYLPSFNGKACVAKEDAVCDIVGGTTWGCVFPSVGCAKPKPATTPAPTTRAPLGPVVIAEVTCPSWAWDSTADDVVMPAIFEDEPEASNPVFADIFKTESSTWYTQEIDPAELLACNEKPTPKPTTAAPTTVPPTTAPPTTAPPTTAPPPTTPAPTTTAPPPTTPAPTTTAPPPTTPAPTTTAPPTTTPPPTTTAPPPTTTPPTPPPETPPPTTEDPCTLPPETTAPPPVTTTPPPDYGPASVVTTTPGPTTPEPVVIEARAPESTTAGPTPAPTTEAPAERPAPTPTVGRTTAAPLSGSRAGESESIVATTLSSVGGSSVAGSTPGMAAWGPIGAVVAVAVAVAVFATVRKHRATRDRAAADGYDGVTMLTPA